MNASEFSNCCLNKSTTCSAVTSTNTMKRILERGNTFALTLFFVTVAWFTSRKRKRREDDEEENEFDINSHYIGPRGASALKKTTSYWNGFMQCLQNPCDSTTNPTGHIALCLAENKLVQEALAIRLMQQGTAITAFSDSIAYCYNGFLGLPSARAAAASFIEKRFWKIHQREDINEMKVDRNGQTSNGEESVEWRNSDTSSSISPDNVAFGSGVGSLLSHLFFIIAQKGDVVLIPAPYYAAFEYDTKAIAGCVPFPVYMDNPITGPTKEDLSNTARLVEKKGHRIKILLLTNPNDPLGVVYQPKVILNAIQWARNRNIHTVMDEIFALTVHKPKRQSDRFQSVIEILDNKLSNDVHFLWGFSKDFGASGFRVAILYTQNARLLQALANLNIFSGVSNPMQLIAAEIMSDDDFIDAFLEDGRSQLMMSYKLCTSKLEEMVVPYVEAQAGLFVYVDFSSLLPEPTFKGEELLANLFQEVARVVMTPGQSQRDCKPGMFRLCYAWVTFDVLVLAMERLSYLVLQIRRKSWDDLTNGTGNWKNEVIKCGTQLSTRRSTINLSELTRTSYH